jgi:Protein of unknown function (DUF2442)
MRANYLPAVVEAQYVSDYLLDITFDDGTRKRVDLSQWFKGPVFEPLRNKNYFKKFFIDATAIAWPNGVDICPEALYEAEDALKPMQSGSRR